MVDFARTPFSRSRPAEPEKDVFNSLRMDEAVALLIRRLVERTGTVPDGIGDVIVGCALQGGENWQFGGRQAVMLAGLPVTVPSAAMDRQCASSMSAVALGALEVMTGNSKVTLAGGMEHMTHVPIGTPTLSRNKRLLTDPAYGMYQMDVGSSMGLTAEKLSAETGITREEMDLYSLESHRRASRAIEDGWFRGEVMEVKAAVDGQEKVISTDQSVRKDTTIEQLRGLRPVFKEDGAITAGNSSPLNAGAAMVELASEEEVKERGWSPLAKVVSFGWVGVEPSLMGKGPVPASKKALDSAGLDAEAIDLWEVNEAFAVVNLYAMKELGIDHGRTNLHGGAISIGHPLGASGARLIGTLARQLKETGKEYGVAALCVGGGQGFATVLQRA